jgi:Phosphoenolpyruvate carboxykinase (ATP)
MLENLSGVKMDLSEAVLYEETLKNGLGFLANNGALIVDTTPYTGRSPNDKFVVLDENTEKLIWWGDVNRPFEREKYYELKKRGSKLSFGEGNFRSKSFRRESSEIQTSPQGDNGESLARPVCQEYVYKA